MLCGASEGNKHPQVPQVYYRPKVMASWQFHVFEQLIFVWIWHLPVRYLVARRGPNRKKTGYTMVWPSMMVGMYAKFSRSFLVKAVIKGHTWYPEHLWHLRGFKSHQSQGDEVSQLAEEVRVWELSSLWSVFLTKVWGKLECPCWHGTLHTSRPPLYFIHQPQVCSWYWTGLCSLCLSADLLVLVKSSPFFLVYMLVSCEITRGGRKKTVVSLPCLDAKTCPIHDRGYCRPTRTLQIR